MRDLILPLALVVAGLAAYHVLFAADWTSSDVPSDEVARLRARVEALEGGTPTPAVLQSDTLARRLATLEARIDALAAGARAPATGTGEEPAPGDPGYVWDDRALEWLDAALKEVRRVDVARRQAERYRSMLKRLAPDEPKVGREEVVALLMAYHDAVRAIYVGGSAGTTEEEREESTRRLGARRADLERNVRALLPDAVAARVMESVPGISPPGGGMRNPTGNK